jgi:Ser/Thr protein kinase RdoA (MazF antagonist)
MWKKEIVEEACQRFQGTENSLRFLGGFYQNVYEYKRHGETCILKLIPMATKDKKQLHFEFEWVSYLRANGIPIPKPILSSRGQMVETIIRLPVPCCVFSFEKANGQKVNPSGMEWSPRLFRRWGKVMGKMHFLSKHFADRASTPFFEEWNEGEIFHRDLSFVEGRIVDRFILFLQKISTFPKSPDTYGLIHNNLHQQNFLVDPTGNMILYDFSKVKYHFYTYDIAIALFHAMQTVPEPEQAQFKEWFLPPFMEGYLLEHKLDKSWREQVEFFLEYRQIFYYLYLMSYYSRDQIDKQTKQTLESLQSRLSIGKTALHF